MKVKHVKHLVCCLPHNTAGAQPGAITTAVNGRECSPGGDLLGQVHQGAHPRLQLEGDTLQERTGGCPFCRPTVPHTLLLLMLTFSPSDCELLIQAKIWIFYFTWHGAGGIQKALNKCQVTQGMHSRRKCNADICQALNSRTVGCQPDKGQQSSGFEPLEALKSYRFMAVPLGSFSSTKESRE